MSFPKVAGVPVLVEGVAVTRRERRLPPKVIHELLEALGLDSSRRGELEAAFSQTFRFIHPWMQTEADQFLNRVAASHEGLRKALAVEPPKTPSTPAVTNIDPCVHLATIFNVSRLRPGMSFSVNLRVSNSGSCTLSSRGPQPVMLSYHWIGPDGDLQEGLRTPLLDDLPPGLTISIPLFVAAPSTPGPFRLMIRAVQEGVEWLEHSSVEFEIEVSGGPSSIDEPNWPRTGKHFAYMDDHFEAVRLLREWAATLLGRPAERVVELGGNANPMIERVDAPVRINVDIDPYGMIVGKMISQSDVHFVVADGMALPIPAHSADVIVMFATFHHFADPIGLLQRLKEFVASDGLLCLMCEPIGHVHRDTIDAEYLAEIRKGVNEQSFALWEYQQMFDVAGFEVAAAQIDVGSAKFGLRPI